MDMADSKKVILEKLLDRLYASLVQGPCLNCRPHSSRQRTDLTAFKAFKHLPPNEIIPKLLTGTNKVDVLAKVPTFESALPTEQLTDEQRKDNTLTSSKADCWTGSERWPRMRLITSTPLARMRFILVTR
jgi:hypothetical protein